MAYAVLLAGLAHSMDLVDAMESSCSPVSRPSGRASCRGSLVAFAIVAAWLAAVGAGLAALGVYESQPGKAAAAPARWPARSGLVRASDRPTLLMLVHAWTSGETMLYDASGRLVFAGGITGSRGHGGDNAGEDAVVAALLGGSGGASEAPVYGCALRRADEASEDAG
jgi:hypothetical protein